MRWLIRSLYAVWMLTLAGCATHPAIDTPFCGVNHIEASGHGLKVFFGTDVNELPSNGFRAGGLTVARAAGHGTSTRYAIKNGLLKRQHQLLSASMWPISTRAWVMKTIHEPGRLCPAPQVN